ncbi:MAG: hypothetical protein KGM99_15740 [Burkholderiales bacterium]|nr:hypothetical protein [Burkholderiales bacterium]
MPYANVDIMDSYRGQLYIDLPYDAAPPGYQDLEVYLQNPDGSMRNLDVEFWHLSLVVAMKNAAHDESGCWNEVMKDWWLNFIILSDFNACTY